MPLTHDEIERMLKILDNDIARKAADTRTNTHYMAKKFLNECGDFSRPAMMMWFNENSLSDNSLRVAYYVVKRLCKALEIKFPLDADDLPPKPDEDTLITPTMTAQDARKLITYWAHRPGEFETSLVFISTILGTRCCEMSATQGLEITRDSIVVSVAKRKTRVVREHKIPENLMCYISGYREISENGIRERFGKCLRYAGINQLDQMNWHSIRRCLATTFRMTGIDQGLYKRFMRWAPNADDMASVYFHYPFDQINAVILGMQPNPETKQYIKHPFIDTWARKP